MNAQANRRLLLKLAAVAVGMFGFGFAMVPLYEKFCQVTGIRNLLAPDEVVNTQVDRSRTVTIEFDANVHELPWRFRPMQPSVTVYPGEIAHIAYEVVNTREQPVAGQAIPSFGPALAGQFVRKLECFCFTRQVLNPGEVRQMPVALVIDPGLPKDVNTITLSYTFFEIAGATTQADEDKVRRTGEHKG